ncbi:MAG: hypothetical protein LBD48_08125 [Treponema sp.]|jgi:predicted transposase/invertase (TIGR01784 family)|nr:hypothetical protein [Treponema sp.]
MLAKRHPEIGEAILTLKQLSWLKERRMIKEQISLREADDRLRKKAAHTEGKVEGQLEIVRRMKARGRPVGEIAEDTGLSAEEIARL